jgi:isoamylase
MCKGLTQQHPDVPEHLRGTYAGLAHPAVIDHLKSLGMTAVELLPVHHFHAFPGHLVSAGLRNYWGYDSLGYFAPYSGYSAAGMAGEQVRNSNHGQGPPRRGHRGHSGRGLQPHGGR